VLPEVSVCVLLASRSVFSTSFSGFLQGVSVCALLDLVITYWGWRKQRQKCKSAWYISVVMGATFVWGARGKV
jgi:membrane-anchored protein YejM (alkaline phosphatase superfamily)